MTSKKRILVIDDESSVRETICENLKECGYTVLEAGDGDSGLKVLGGENRPQLVITDLIMPKKEGLETIVEIKKRYPDVRIIAISGGGRTKTMDFLEMAKNLGVDAVVPKPLDMDDFERIVAAVASRIPS